MNDGLCVVRATADGDVEVAMPIDISQDNLERVVAGVLKSAIERGVDVVAAMKRVAKNRVVHREEIRVPA